MTAPTPTHDEMRYLLIDSLKVPSPAQSEAYIAAAEQTEQKLTAFEVTVRELTGTLEGVERERDKALADYQFMVERTSKEKPKYDELARLLDEIRQDGWAVAVHNDYRLNGEPHTFWLFTKGDRCAKGEGKTDIGALLNAREAARRALPDKRPEEAEALLVEIANEDTQWLAHELGTNLADRLTDWKKCYDARTKA